MVTPKSPQKEFHKLSLEDQITEVFYLRSTELLKPVFYTINSAFPLAERKKNEKMADKYNAAYDQAKGFRNFYKNVVRDSILPLAIVKKHSTAFEADGPTRDLRCLIENQFRMLHKRLCDYADMLVPPPCVEPMLQSLNKVLETELFTLLNSTSPNGLTNYQAIPRFTNPEGF